MAKTFVKLNDGKNNLSLGNLVNIIKKYSKVKESSIQQEVFCAIFDIKDINNTTVNNYLIGYRAIGLNYKKIYIDLKSNFSKNYNIFFKNISNILTILEEHLYLEEELTLDIINNNDKLKLVCNDLLLLTKEDLGVSDSFLIKVNRLFNENNIYECFIEFLMFTILEKKQPIFIQKIDKNIREYELDEYLKINLYEGISYISNLLELGKKDNVYANAELGSLEYSGLINGNIDYEKCYNFYLKASKKDHPKACWMVANLILMNKVEEKSIEVMWNYLNKAYKLGSIAAINTIGKCYMNGTTLDGKKDISKGLEYFKKASDMGYSFSYNNLGNYYEKNNDMENALKYYKLSSDLNNSWALNKVGEILRKNNKTEEAYFYYEKAIECPKGERCYYAYYNLATYYYMEGPKKDLEKAKEYLNIFENNKTHLY